MRKKVAYYLSEQARKGEAIRLAPAMRKAGYSETTINSGMRVRDVRESTEVKSALHRFTSQIDNFVENSFIEAEKKREQSSFRDNVNAIVELTKTKRLINGLSTDNVLTISAILDKAKDE